MKRDGFRNRYSFDMDGKTITLVPLTPQQVYDDQLRLTGDEEKVKDKLKESLFIKKGELGGGNELVTANISLPSLYSSLL